jgi:succinyl-CoA synthetase alpha subunit
LWSFFLILIDNKTRVLCQGFTGEQATFHCQKCIEYGTNIVSGVTPFKGGEIHLERPVFNTVFEAVQKTNAQVSLIFVPKEVAFEAIIESIEANLELIVCITEGIPILDMVSIKSILKKSKTKLIGPNCPGIITPGYSKIGIMPGSIHKKGGVGVVSRSGTLTYEAVDQLTKIGLGQSTCVGIGGDPIKGMSFVDVLELFMEDDGTQGILMIGEIGGEDELEAVDCIKTYRRKGILKPVVAFIAGITAPPQKRMGHAGAIVSTPFEAAQSKIDYLKSHDIIIADSIYDLGSAMKNALQ